MIQQRNMMDFYPNKGKISNIEHARSPLPMSNSPRPTSFKPLKVNLPTVPTDSPGLKGKFCTYSCQFRIGGIQKLHRQEGVGGWSKMNKNLFT